MTTSEAEEPEGVPAVDHGALLPPEGLSTQGRSSPAAQAPACAGSGACSFGRKRRTKKAFGRPFAESTSRRQNTLVPEGGIEPPQSVNPGGF